MRRNLYTRLGRGWIVPAGLLLSIVSGCAVLPMGSPVEKPRAIAGDPLVLSVSLPKSVFWPGEAIPVTVSLQNVSSKPIEVVPPSMDATSFWTGESKLQLYEYSPLDFGDSAGLSKVRLRPGHILEHEFLFTRLAPGKGDFELVASSKITKDDEDALFSQPIGIRIFGKPEFQRNAEGLMTETDAIETVNKSVDGRVIKSTASLIDGESGKKRWWIDIEYVDSEGMKDTTAYTIDPYSGVVLAEALPIEPEPVDVTE